jgi:hypothetical protein
MSLQYNVRKIVKLSHTLLKDMTVSDEGNVSICGGNFIFVACFLIQAVLKN